MKQEGLELGRQLRDEGIARTIDHQPPDWLMRYRILANRYLESVRVGAQFTGEDLRAHALSHGLEQPSHVNAWSGAARSVLSTWLRDRRVRQDGILQCERPESHARIIRAYRKSKL